MRFSRSGSEPDLATRRNSNMSTASQAALQTYRVKNPTRTPPNSVPTDPMTPSAPRTVPRQIRPGYQKANTTGSSAALVAASLVAKSKPLSMVSTRPTSAPRRTSYLKRPSLGHSPATSPDLLKSSSTVRSPDPPRGSPTFGSDFDPYDYDSNYNASSDSLAVPAFTTSKLPSPALKPAFKPSYTVSTDVSPLTEKSPVMKTGLRPSTTSLLRRKPPPTGSPTTISVESASPSLENVGSASSLTQPYSNSSPRQTTNGSFSQTHLNANDSFSPRKSPSLPFASGDSESDYESAFESGLDSDTSYDSELPQYSLADSTRVHHHHHHHHHYRTGISKMFRPREDSLSNPVDPSAPVSNRVPTRTLQGTTASPQLVFRTTLREEKKALKKKVKKTKKSKEFDESKPWKNHKDSTHVSKEEYELYEEVWDVNRDRYIDKLSTQPTSSNGDICQFLHLLPAERIVAPVVLELWGRSQLGNMVLGRIWALVVNQRRLTFNRLQNDAGKPTPDVDLEEFDDGTLTKCEFFAGMWLIDQCLYGRKLPKHISQEVWLSVETDPQLRKKKRMLSLR